jgi:hypothetical protein
MSSEVERVPGGELESGHAQVTPDAPRIKTAETQENADKPS